MRIMIVESPNKVAKIKKMLPGGDWVVAASVGHVRDLPEHDLGVEFAENGAIKVEYVVSDRGKRVLRDLQKACRAADMVYLATDPDREGEAISWHLATSLGLRTYRRVVFRALTPSALKEGLANARSIDMNLVNAQQARRVLDRIVGWWVSPTCRRGTGDTRAKSAGRVQSVALRLVVERDREIDSFVSKKFWGIRAHWKRQVGGSDVTTYGDLVELIDGPQRHPVNPGLADEREAKQLADSWASSDDWIVEQVIREDASIPPPPPFTTSTIVQAASVQFRWRPDATMRVLQQLFESGRITYHRTDSVALSPEAIAMARNTIERLHGAQALYPGGRSYATRSANAQEAHEAIRPTDSDLDPSTIADDKERALYQLILLRFLACQMRDAVEERTRARVVVARRGVFLSRAVRLKSQGWKMLMAEAAEREQDEDEDERPSDVPIDPWDGSNTGDRLQCISCAVRAIKTQPPKRYTQASLVKALERQGIGRPSTYAAIMTKLLDYGYVEEKRLKLQSTEVGRKLVDFLVKSYAGDFIEVDYTARMEALLDDIADGRAQWERVVMEASERLIKLAHAAGFPYNDIRIASTQKHDRRHRQQQR